MKLGTQHPVPNTLAFDDTNTPMSLNSLRLQADISLMVNINILLFHSLSKLRSDIICVAQCNVQILYYLLLSIADTVLASSFLFTNCVLISVFMSLSLSANLCGCSGQPTCCCLA